MTNLQICLQALLKIIWIWLPLLLLLILWGLVEAIERKWETKKNGRI